MKSPFDLNRQNKKIESKIVVALERISEAFRVLLWNESKQNALSPIQIQILIFLLFHPKEQATVSYLAGEFNLTKATVSDSVKLLLQKGLVKKLESPVDTRSYLIGLTAAGKQSAEQSANFAFAIEHPLASLSQEQKEIMLGGLLKLIHDLNRAGIISVQRMCYTCSHYKNKQGSHFCSLLNAQLAATEIRLDCPEHFVAG